MSKQKEIAMSEDGSLNHIPYWVPFTSRAPPQFQESQTKAFGTVVHTSQWVLALPERGLGGWGPVDSMLRSGAEIYVNSPRALVFMLGRHQHNRFQVYISLSWEKLLQPKPLPTPQTSIPAPLGEEASWKWFCCALIEMISQSKGRPLSRTEMALRGHRDSGRNE